MSENTTTKNITTVEELTTLTGTEKVFISSNGTIKQIAPENAKFGGGTVTTFYLGEEVAAAAEVAATPEVYANFYKDSALTEKATPQEVFDACMAGIVWMTDNSGQYMTIVDFVANGSGPEHVTYFRANYWLGNDFGFTAIRCGTLPE